MTGLRTALLIALLAATGCAGGQPGAAVGVAAPGHTLRVGLVEWRVVTSSRAVLTGADRLTVTNTGTVRHDLQVTGPGVNAHTPLLDPGGSATLTISPHVGSTLTLTCEVAGHEEAGMRTTVTVTG